MMFCFCIGNVCWVGVYFFRFPFSGDSFWSEKNVEITELLASLQKDMSRLLNRVIERY